MAAPVTGLFVQVDEVWDDLPPMPETAGNVRTVAKSFALQCDNLYTQVREHEEDAAAESEDGDEEPQNPPTVHLDGRIIKEFLTALAMVMCAWFDKPRTLRVMEAVNEGNEELLYCREILEDTSAKGNA